MTTDTTRRHTLYEHARNSWGVEAAETLMDYLPPDPAALATKTDVSVLGSELRMEMAQMGGELRSEMAQMGGELRSEMAQQTRLLMITMLTTTLTIILAVLGAALAT